MKILSIKKIEEARQDSMPDIDCDFPTAYRDDVKAYMTRRYGEHYVCSVGTYTRMKLKTCLKDFGKVMGLPFDKMNKLTKDIDDQIEYTWGDLFAYATQSRELYKFVQEYPELVHMTKYALLQCKTASVHPSAVIIVPKEDANGQPMDLFSWMPCKMMGGVLISEWEGKYIDKSGFLKEDILGLNQLDKFDAIIKLIEKNYNKHIDVNEIPFDDEQVFRYFQLGWCEDVFQFGAMGLMNYCRQAQPHSLEDLVAMTALFRPGPMDVEAHRQFVDIKNGKRKPEYDPGMKDITKDTYSLYTYQEQIMKAVVVGGLSPVESDILRTAIKKKKMDLIESFHGKFREGYMRLLEREGVSDPGRKADEVWNKLLAFSGYGFNKSHAVAYTIMSYWSMWFKVNYPLEFWTVSLQFATESDVGYRLVEMKKTKEPLEVRPPDINFSADTFTCDPANNRIFFSLGKIKGVGEKALEALTALKAKTGEVFSFEDFISAAGKGVNRTIVMRLIQGGAFDLVENLTSPRQRLRVLEDYLERRGEPLPDEFKDPAVQTNAWWTYRQRELTGYGEIDYHQILMDSIPSKRVAKLYVTTEQFGRMRNGTEVCLVGKVNNVFERQIKNGTMANVHIEMNDMMVQVTLWPDFWQTCGFDEMSLRGRIIAVSGEIDTFAGKRVLKSNRQTKLYTLQ